MKEITRFCFQQPEKGQYAVLPWANVCCTPRVVIYVLSSQAQGAKSQGSATDANVNSEKNAQGFCGPWSRLARDRVHMHRAHRWSLPHPPSVVIVASGIAGARMAQRPGASWIAASSPKTSKTATSMVHNVGRAQEHGAGQGIKLKLMACPLAPRYVTTYGHLDALAIVFLSRPCTTVRGRWKVTGRQ